MTIYSVLRTGVFVEFFLLAGQALAVILFYSRARRAMRKANRSGLLPLHVVLVTVVFLGLAAEAVVRTRQAVAAGVGLTPWLPINLVLLGLGDVALFTVMRFEHTRVHQASKILVEEDDARVTVDEATGDSRRDPR